MELSVLRRYLGFTSNNHFWNTMPPADANGARNEEIPVKGIGSFHIDTKAKI
jgi:hypothetical protein